jgi:hypothetical protein
MIFAFSITLRGIILFLVYFPFTAINPLQHLYGSQPFKQTSVPRDFRLSDISWRSDNEGFPRLADVMRRKRIFSTTGFHRLNGPTTHLRGQDA